MNLEEKKAFAEWQRELIAKIENKIKRRMNILRHNKRLQQKMENEIKKSLSK